jgi:hypothetical protein
VLLLNAEPCSAGIVAKAMREPHQISCRMRT